MEAKTNSYLKLALVSVLIFAVATLSVSSNQEMRVHHLFKLINQFTVLIIILGCIIFAGSLILWIFSGFKNRIYAKTFLFSLFLLISAGMYIFFFTYRINLP